MEASSKKKKAKKTHNCVLLQACAPHAPEPKALVSLYWVPTLLPAFHMVGQRTEKNPQHRCPSKCLTWSHGLFSRVTRPSGSTGPPFWWWFPFPALFWNPTVGGNRERPQARGSAFSLSVLDCTEGDRNCYQGISLRWSVLCEGACSCPCAVIIFHGSACALFYNAILGTERSTDQTFKTEPGLLKL